MLKKRYTKSHCKVTFEVDYLPDAEVIQIAGDFNEWQPESLDRLKSGKHKITVNLDPERAYSFRYLVDGEWENEWYADRYEANGLGVENSVVEC